MLITRLGVSERVIPGLFFIIQKGWFALKFYTDSVEEVFNEVKSSQEGLSVSESEKRLAEHGKNKLAEGKKTPWIIRFLSQLKDPMIIILIVAAFLSVAVSGFTDYIDAIIILIVVLINAILGVLQESKAEKAIEALQKMSAATSKVLRDGNVHVIKSEDLVVGDVVLLEAGDAVPADGRIIESASLKIEEAALTGESVPVTKDVSVIGEKDGKAVPLGDRKNMVYMGSTVVYGRGKAIITSTGMGTEMGKIADALAKAEDGQTPLQKKLTQLSKVLTVLVLGISVFIFAFSLIKSGSLEIKNILDTFMVAVSLAVAAIPEGLAAVVTIVLSIGVTNMSKRNAIIRKLTAVETLGCAQIICSDKTGTLTQNKMTVVEHFSNNQDLLATAMALCNDAELDENYEATGEPTECALVNYAYSLELNKNDLKTKIVRIGEAPFDSGRKMMSTVHEKDGKYIQFTKGAPDVLLGLCTKYIDEKGAIVALDDTIREKIVAHNKAMAHKALRVLAAATREIESIPSSYEPTDLEHDLTFIGLTGMIDPIRPEVSAAIEECKSAGIRAVMITGDHRDTAVAIATELGIITDESQAITGAQLDEISDEELETEIENFGVYARVQPEHKVRIVNAWRKKGYVTAMTGDGVNDAPSIKSADIGVGMGITGTDVTKNVADMVLADDNFATIVGAVGEGRRIYDNIRKAIQFLLASNMSEVLSIFFATLLGFTILKPVHLLWINLITDCFPALALGMEKGEPDLMNRPPRKSTDGIFAGGVGFDIAYQGFLVTILTIAAYLIGHFMESGYWEFVDSPDGMTMAFLTLSMAEIFHSFNMRSQRGSVFSLKGQNKYLWGAGILSLLLTTAVIYVPFLKNAFGFEPISLEEYGVALLLAFSIIPLVEIVKLVRRAIDKRKAKKVK
ncbi:MAG: calcium-translocating P-type ATPase, PMCA-type [Clostridiales bacterium]|nr:MAG: calcium-translocating P-type ATPase, PMCA-type [Clostridiales bacterium]